MSRINYIFIVYILLAIIILFSVFIAYYTIYQASKELSIVEVKIARGDYDVHS